MSTTTPEQRDSYRGSPLQALIAWSLATLVCLALYALAVKAIHPDW